jgi:hypothetical protein
MIFVCGGFRVEDLPAHVRKRQIGLAGDDVVGQPDDLLLVAFVADFRSADDDDQLRPQPFQIRDQLQRLGYVPDVHADADDLRLMAENRFDDVDGALVDVELKNPRRACNSPRLAIKYRNPNAQCAYFAFSVVRMMSGMLAANYVTASAPGNARIISHHVEKTALPVYFLSSGVKRNFCPPTLASNIKPFFGTVNTITPCLYFASAEAPSAAMMALTAALMAHSLPSKLSNEALSSKKITSAKLWPPNCAPMVNWVIRGRAHQLAFFVDFTGAGGATNTDSAFADTGKHDVGIRRVEKLLDFRIRFLDERGCRPPPACAGRLTLHPPTPLWRPRALPLQSD